MIYRGKIFETDLSRSFFSIKTISLLAGLNISFKLLFCFNALNSSNKNFLLYEIQ
ncbi:MAG: hypothetical protein XD81_0526 [Bacteroidetes bacterium 38_7]|nr:MAG: hypothetical protein XD81_0526 [Bacteroidetes bacterium 38_7]